MDFTEPPPISSSTALGETRMSAPGARSSARDGRCSVVNQIRRCHVCGRIQNRGGEDADGEENDRRGKDINGKKSELRGHRIAHLPPVITITAAIEIQNATQIPEIAIDTRIIACRVSNPATATPAFDMSTAPSQPANDG